jgi:hypothetical protein
MFLSNCVLSVSISLNHLSSNFFHQVQISRVAASSTYFSTLHSNVFNAGQWERLISTHMPNLCVFDFQEENHLSHHNFDQLTDETRVNKFNSLFWTNQQWFFDYQYYRQKYRNTAIFYSTDPYR